MNNTLILFTKEPIIGEVKTRLIPTLGVKGAYNLCCRLINIMINRFKDTDSRPLIIYTYPKLKKNDSFFKSGIKVKYQSGEDLGERMYNALAQELHYSDKVILFGSDCPFITKNVIAEVLEKLDNYDLIFVPANDGGYVLVAAREVDMNIFKNISWSTSQVMMQTCQQMDKLSLSYYLLDPLVDIDDANDLINLKKENFYEV